jgi:hypothetical protein
MCPGRFDENRASVNTWLHSSNRVTSQRSMPLGKVILTIGLSPRGLAYSAGGSSGFGR